MGFPQRYDMAASERRWQETWARERIYEFNVAASGVDDGRRRPARAERLLPGGELVRAPGRVGVDDPSRRAGGEEARESRRGWEQCC